jgi:hypothetical protein
MLGKHVASETRTMHVLSLPAGIAAEASSTGHGARASKALAVLPTNASTSAVRPVRPTTSSHCLAPRPHRFLDHLDRVEHRVHGAAGIKGEPALHLLRPSLSIAETSDHRPLEFPDGSTRSHTSRT